MTSYKKYKKINIMTAIVMIQGNNLNDGTKVN